MDNRLVLSFRTTERNKADRQTDIAAAAAAAKKLDRQTDRHCCCCCCCKKARQTDRQTCCCCCCCEKARQTDRHCCGCEKARQTDRQTDTAAAAAPRKSFVDDRLVLCLFGQSTEQERSEKYTKQNKNNAHNGIKEKSTSSMIPCSNATIWCEDGGSKKKKKTMHIKA